MNIHILGTGNVARTLAVRLKELGHRVELETRNPEDTLSRTFGDGTVMSDWLKTNDVSLSSFGTTTSEADLLINASNGKGTLEMLHRVGAEALKGKVLLDLSNPLDFSNGMPPTLFVCNDDSLGEQIQREFPDLQVVKSLNTLTAPLMLTPHKLKGDHVVFLSGNHAEAKAKVRAMEESAGWKTENIIDLGDITTARGTEQWLALWVRLYGSSGSALFNLNLVK
ncbi:MAG: NAD(P)-binding domain-containing protein [Flavobacteriales bacterium]|nr:NAD(P)-binding domain-containing protein [Flavobacteriales bacterium]